MALKEKVLERTLTLWKRQPGYHILQ